MFNKMQYIFELPTTEKLWVERKCQIKDNDGHILGNVTRSKIKFRDIFWFEDTNGARLAELRLKRGFGSIHYEIYDQMDELRGTISPPVGSGPFVLLDHTRRQIAISDAFSFGIHRFNRLRERGLCIRAIDGNTVAIIHAAPSSQDCQIDIFPSDISQLQILSLAASILLF